MKYKYGPLLQTTNVKDFHELIGHLGQLQNLYIRLDPCVISRIENKQENYIMFVFSATCLHVETKITRSYKGFKCFGAISGISKGEGMQMLHPTPLHGIAEDGIKCLAIQCSVRMGKAGID